RQSSLPSSISSSSSSIRAVYFTSKMSSKLSSNRSVTTIPSSVGVNRPPSLVTYSRSSIVERMEAYVDGLPTPLSSNSLTSVASLKRGGGSVKCCSGLMARNLSVSPSTTAGSLCFSSSSSSSFSSFPSTYTLRKPSNFGTDPVARNRYSR